MKQVIYRNCKKCSASFVIPSPNRKFCDDCMIVKTPVPSAICKTCGADFIKKGNRRHCVDCKPSREKSWTQCAKCSGPLGSSSKKRCSDCDRSHPKHKLQNGNCDICGKFGQLNRDHDHSCCEQRSFWDRCGKCERGLLCNSCNMFLGQINDSPETLQNAINYLTRNVMYARI